MPATTVRTPTFFLTQAGATFVRWRGALAYIKGQSGSALRDRLVGPVLRQVDDDTAVRLVQAWRDGRREAVQAARELATERSPTDPGRRVRRLRKAPVGLVRPPHPLAPQLRRAGWFAYAMGIDRSPAHDGSISETLAQVPNAEVLVLLRAWEAGWDEAHQRAGQLALERKPRLVRPSIEGSGWTWPSSDPSDAA